MPVTTPLNVYTACLAAIGAHGYFTGVRLALALVTLKQTESAAWVGLVLAAYALLPALLSPRIGRLIDQRGVRPVLWAGLSVLVGTGLLLAALPHHAVTLCVAALGTGLGFNAFALSIQKLIGGLPPQARHSGATAAETRKRHFGTLATASSISSFIGPLLAGWGLDRLPAPVVFACLVLMPALAWGLVFTWHLPRVSARPTGAAAAPSGRSPLRARALWPLAAGIVMVTLAADALGFAAPLVGQAMALPAATVGIVVSAASVGSFLIRLSSGFFIARLREWTYLCACLLACAVLLLVFAKSGSVPILVGVSALVGAWLGLAQPMTQTLLHHAVPEHRVGEALGARLALVGATQASGPFLMGLAVEWAGVGAMLLGVSLVLLASACYIGLASRAPQTTTAQGAGDDRNT